MTIYAAETSKKQEHGACANVFLILRSGTKKVSGAMFVSGWLGTKPQYSRCSKINQPELCKKGVT
jgi:hypothetical protein